jgi:hypothetical protein
MKRAGAALLIVVAAAQVWMAHRWFGFLTGDDVEVLAEAFHRAIGFQYRPWDIRTLFVPDFVVAPMVWFGHAVGVRDTRTLIEIATLPFIALTLVTIVLTYRLTLRWTNGDRIAAGAAAVLVALHWIPLGFGATVYPRTVAMAAIVAAALLVERFPWIAGALLGVAFADRFSEIVFLVPLLIVARRNAWKVAIGAAASILVTVGLYDWITWGEPFGTLSRFANLTLVEPDFASRVKYQGPLWYVRNVVRWCAPSLLPLLFFCRRVEAWIWIVVPLVLLSLVQHKELRYLEALIPFAMIAAAIGFAALWRTHRAIAAVLIAVSIPWDLIGLRAFVHKTMPCVMAARDLAANPRVNTVAMSQLWAYGDRLYLTDRMNVRDVNTPPTTLAENLPGADAVALYEADVQEDPHIAATLTANHFVPFRTYRWDPARTVVVWLRR